MLLNAFFTATCQETGDEQTPQSFTAYDVTILSEEQRVPVDSFISTFVQTVNSREKLKDVFDISDRRSIEFAEYVKELLLNVLKALGIKNSEILDDFATRPMKQNMKSFSPQSMITVYGRLLATYLYSEGYMTTQDNAKELALKFFEYMESNANTYLVQGDTSTKFPAITNGFMEFLLYFNNSDDEFSTAERAVKFSVLHESLWLLTAIETSNSNDLYTKCVSEANDSKSGSDSISSESTESNSGLDSSCFQSTESNSGSDSSSSETTESNSGSDSSSFESTESNSGSDSSSFESTERNSGSDSSSFESTESNSGSDSATCQETIDEQMVLSFVAFDVTILSEEQRAPVDSFISTFVEVVYGQKKLKDVFDITDASPFDLAQYLINFIQNVMAEKEAEEPHVRLLPEFSTRPLEQNFNSLSPQSMITVYARMIALFLDSERKLTQDNAQDLAQKCAEKMKSSANEYVVQGDTSTKFIAITNGFLECLKSLNDDDEFLTAKRAVVISILYESQWSLRAAETQSLNDLYIKCIFEFNGYVSNSTSGSDSSSFESAESNSGSVSSSSK
ncbi:uncharacterized protein TNCT_532091 [Trichonephila clavata]|uniref:Uncharacterized protein n=1 Tax=Trichonephila clavata TaxID=2740835 RepID=A0A8X6JJ15_TRICU|nr:uncharacterized protein TNCT_532091 [Trichonephila clavata]